MGRQALLLSGSIGLGHDMMARACAEVLHEYDWCCETRDSIDLLGSTGGRLASRISAKLMSTPGLHDALHFAHLRTGSGLALAMAKASGARLVPALQAELRRRPADLVLSVFATGAQAAAELKSRGVVRRSVVLCTDACVHRLWVWPGTDLFLVTSHAAEMSVRRFQPDAEVRVVPAPVRAAFFDAPPRTQARRVLGVPDDAPCVLMMDSGWSFGPTVQTARRLSRAGVHVLAVAGRDGRLAQQLSVLGDETDRVHSFGFTDQIPLLMSAADLVMTLPGATTCGEARALGRPLMLLDLMPGHGRDNLQQQLDLGDAYTCDATPAGTTGAILAAFARGLPSGPRTPTRVWPDAFASALDDIGLRVRGSRRPGATAQHRPDTEEAARR